MDVLVIGGAGNVIDAIINKLNKEGHRVYVLTGSKFSVGKYHRVYEKYNFEYDNECINEVFDSISPDVVIFMGAFDTNYKWKAARREAVSYSGGLINTLIAFSTIKKGKFIYLSSDDVYDDGYAHNIVEDIPTNGISLKAMAIAQGETVCQNYKQTMGLNIIILRLDHLIDIPLTKEDINEDCGRMCLSAIRIGKVHINSNHTYSLLYISDAVEFIYKVINAENHKYGIYNISSSEAFSDLEIAETIKSLLGAVSIVDDTTGEMKRKVLSNERFKNEFGLSIRNTKEIIVENITNYIKRHLAKFIDPGDEGLGFFGRLYQRSKAIFWALLPFAENIAVFIPFFMLNNRAVGNEFFGRLDLYLIYVLIFAIIHGQQQATFSAMLSVAGYCFRQMYNRSGLDLLVDYNTYVWIGHLFILGLVVGYMKDRLNLIKVEHDYSINYLEEQLDDIQDINTSNVRMKNILETQVINQNDSIGKIYEVVSTLDKYEPEEVLFYSSEVLSNLINSKDVAIYVVSNRSYARIISATSSKARVLGNSVNYIELTEMYDDLKNRRVYINKTLDEKYPLMANAIYSDDQMQFILMVWGIPWERMTLTHANMLVVIGYMIQNAVMRANKYLEMLENKRYIEGTNILDMDAFSSLVRAFMRAKSKDLTICTILEINAREYDYDNTSKILATKLRANDYLGMLKNGKLYALLSNTSNEDAQIVIKRFNDLGYKSFITEDLIYE